MLFVVIDVTYDGVNATEMRFTPQQADDTTSNGVRLRSSESAIYWRHTIHRSRTATAVRNGGGEGHTGTAHYHVVRHRPASRSRRSLITSWSLEDESLSRRYR